MLRLEEQIEELRAEMIILTFAKNSFMDEEVVGISQQLDKLMFRIQKQKMTRHL